MSDGNNTDATGKPMMSNEDAMAHLMKSMMNWQNESQRVMSEHNAYASRVMAGKQELESDANKKKSGESVKK